MNSYESHEENQTEAFLPMDQYPCTTELTPIYINGLTQHILEK